MSHHVDDIRTALQQSPAVREAVAAMLAALDEAWRMDKGQEHDTLEIEFSNQREVTDCMERIAAASKAVDKWIMKESGEDDMDAERTVAVQKAIGALKALVSIANGAEWSAYQQLETDTRGIVTERMAEAILDTLQQPPVDALTEAQQRIAELEAEVGKLQQAAEMSNNLWLDEKRRYEGLYRTHIQLQHEHEELGNLVIHSLGASPADWGRSQASIEALIDQNIELTSSDNRETRNDWSDTELGENTITNGIFRLKERITELEAEVAWLQVKRNSAVRDANKPLLKLLERMEYILWEIDHIESNSPLKREARFVLKLIREEKERLAASPSIPESEATDGA